MASFKLKRFGVGAAIGNMWKNSGALGKTAMVGTGLAATGAVAGTVGAAAKFGSESKKALEGNMGNNA